LLADRGFTAHEFLPDFNLYNMNGRLYDPVVGRFLSPDPYISDPSFSQSYNRYSYCLNNPLKYSDPSGELPNWALWPTTWFGNWLIGGFDRWVNKKESFKQAFSFKNNPVVVSANYSPSANQLSNYQVDAHNLPNREALVKQQLENQIAEIKSYPRWKILMAEIIIMTDGAVNYYSDFLGGPTGENVSTVDKVDYFVKTYAGGKLLIGGISVAKLKFKTVSELGLKDGMKVSSK